jgi:hypothetical protein
MQARARHGRVDGYVKPLINDLDVYDRRQDSGQPLFHQVYEAAVGGIGALLENPRDTVATETRVSGATANPNLSAWQMILNLFRNAFIRSILPGFEHAVRQRLGA